MKRAINFNKITIQGAKLQLFFGIRKYFDKKIIFFKQLLHIWIFFCIFAVDLRVVASELGK